MISAEKAVRYAEECEVFVAADKRPTSEAASLRGKLGQARASNGGAMARPLYGPSSGDKYLASTLGSTIHYAGHYDGGLVT